MDAIVLLYSIFPRVIEQLCSKRTKVRCVQVYLDTRFQLEETPIASNFPGCLKLRCRGPANFLLQHYTNIGFVLVFGGVGIFLASDPTYLGNIQVTKGVVKKELQDRLTMYLQKNS